MKRRIQRPVAVLILAAVALAAAPSAAQPTAADKETARALVLDGRAKLQTKDYQGALKAFQGAHALMGVPTTGLDLARAQEALGLLVEARATALEVARMPEARGEPAAFTNARPAAAALAEKVAQRIPSIEVRLKGLPASATPAVAIDGIPIPAAALSLPRKVNPGTHAIEVAASGFAPERRTVQVKEREVLSVEIALAPVDPPKAAGPRGAAEAGATPAEARESSGVPAWAWGAGAAGIVALGVSVAFVVDHASVRGTVADDCPGDVCDPQQHDAAGVEDLKARWNRDLGLAAGFGALGLASVGVAVYGIVTAPTAKANDAGGRGARPLAMTPWLSSEAAGATLAGSF